MGILALILIALCAFFISELILFVIAIIKFLVIVGLALLILISVLYTSGHYAPAVFLTVLLVGPFVYYKWFYKEEGEEGKKST